MTKTIKDILDTDNLNIRGTVLFAEHAEQPIQTRGVRTATDLP